MAKEKLGLKDTLGLSPKFNVKKTEIDVEKTEKAVKEIHSTREEYHRLTIDLPIDVYEKMAHKLVGKKLSGKKLTHRMYITMLIEADMNK